MMAVADDAVAQGYATAIAAAAGAEGVLDRVADELFGFAQIVDSRPELRERLADPAEPTASKLDVVGDLLSGRAHTQTLAAVAYVLQAGRARSLLGIAEGVAHRAAEANNASFAEVRTAVALDDAQRQRLTAALTAAVGRPVDLKVVVDPDVVGGVVAKVGDTVIDGTVARRLSAMRGRLVGA